jgi:hypothetical protein
VLNIVCGVVVLGQPGLEAYEVDQFFVAVMRQVECAAEVLKVQKRLRADVLEAARVLVDVHAVRVERVLNPRLESVGPTDSSNQL